MLPQVCLRPYCVKACLIWLMSSAGMKQQVFMVYTEPSTMWFGGAGSEKLAIVIGFRVAYAIFPRKMYFFCHGEMPFKKLLIGVKYVCFTSLQTLSLHCLVLTIQKCKKIVFLPVAIMTHVASNFRSLEFGWIMLQRVKFACLYYWGPP